MAETDTADVATFEQTWHTHTDVSRRYWIGRNVSAMRAANNIHDDVVTFLQAHRDMHGMPASEFDGMVIRVGGRLVGVVDTVGVDEVDTHTLMLIDWSHGDIHAATVADWIGQ